MLQRIPCAESQIMSSNLRAFQALASALWHQIFATDHILVEREALERTFCFVEEELVFTNVRIIVVGGKARGTPKTCHAFPYQSVSEVRVEWAISADGGSGKLMMGLSSGTRIETTSRCHDDLMEAQRMITERAWSTLRPSRVALGL
ncbi:MAG: hypothetical protein EI684_10460 [Candidatus Viridilinea halotolerans]|uniref:Bacterial Pleckstrin homology domain-containing protein n=1 Tax=Candidatus Viridilinea halotolerans TaxID=2491704 RepID=A0A426U050_9CHLR|nr:MAG: hypothetical protein EI684_10460 [Candidatus Viridilinea halotolerans]